MVFFGVNWYGIIMKKLKKWIFFKFFILFFVVGTGCAFSEASNPFLERASQRFFLGKKPSYCLLRYPSDSFDFKEFDRPVVFEMKERDLRGSTRVRLFWQKSPVKTERFEEMKYWRGVKKAGVTLFSLEHTFEK